MTTKETQLSIEFNRLKNIIKEDVMEKIVSLTTEQLKSIPLSNNIESQFISVLIAMRES